MGSLEHLITNLWGHRSLDNTGYDLFKIEICVWNCDFLIVVWVKCVNIAVLSLYSMFLFLFHRNSYRWTQILFVLILYLEDIKKQICLDLKQQQIRIYWFIDLMISRLIFFFALLRAVRLFFLFVFLQMYLAFPFFFCPFKSNSFLFLFGSFEGVVDNGMFMCLNLINQWIEL